SPLALPPQSGENFEADSSGAYRSNEATGREPDLFFYPGRGRPSANGSNKWVGEILAAVHTSPPLEWLLGAYYAWQLVLSHCLFLSAIICYAWLSMSQPTSSNLKRLRQVAVIVIMLFLTVALNYLTVAAFQVARMRYAIA